MMNLKAKTIAAAIAVALTAATVPAMAQDMQALLELLRAKGVITQAEFDQHTKAAAEAAENKAFIEKRVDADVTKTNKYVEKHAKDGSVKSNGLGWVSEDGKNELNLTGRLHFDARSFSEGWGSVTDRDSGSMGDRFSVRRARLGINGIFNKDIAYELVTNLTAATTNAGATNSTAFIDTAWANYTIDPALQVRIGRMKQPVSMETLTSSNNIDFMERSYLDQLAPGKQNGLMVHGELKGVNYAMSGFQNGYDSVTNSNSISPQFGARLSTDLAKMFSGDANSKIVLHVGVSGMAGKQEVVPATSSQKGSTFETKGAFIAFRDENMGLNNVFRDRIYGSCPYNSPALGGGAVGSCTAAPLGYSLPAQDAAQVDKLMQAFEFAGAYGPAKLQYEYADAKLTAKSHAQNTGGTAAWDTESSGHAKVQYVSFLYNITGEEWKDTYKGGLFGGIKPKSNFNFKDGSGTGAWQVAARVSQYDASSFGTSTNGTVPADEETSPGNGKHACTGSGSNNCYQIGGSPKGTTYTAGLNWILNPNARIMLNYSMTKFGNAFYPVDIGTVNGNSKATDTSHVISLRSQFNF